MGYQRRPNTPASVERQLRQEAGFGCVKCGHPYIEYHHIVPFAEDNHFRPEDMMAVCPNCHSAVAKLGRDRQYEIKQRPFNGERGFAKGALEYDKRDLVFKIGGNWYENVRTILQYYNDPLISCRLEDGQAKVSLNLLDQLGRSMLRVQDNDVVFRINDMWDFEYGHNTATARYGAGDIALRMDFRGAEATIEGKLWLSGMEVTLGPQHTSLGGGVFSGCRMTNIGIAFQVGPEEQDRPQYRLL